MIDVVLEAARDVFAQAAKDIPGTAKTFSAAAEGSGISDGGCAFS
jgi:hypothetical protein